MSEIGVAPGNSDLQLQLEPVKGVVGGVYFPTETARHTLWRLLCLQHWPEIAQAKLDEQKGLYEFRLARERAVTAAVKSAPPQRSGPSWYGAIMAGAVAFGVGVVAGGIVIWVAGSH